MLIPIPKPHPPTVCNSMWALTDFTEANGATRIIPGTHLSDHSPDYGPPYDSIPAEMARGSVLVWHGSLWHGGGANQTDDRRIGIAMNYCAGYIRQQENQQLGLPPALVRTFPQPPAGARRLRHLQRPHRPHRQAGPARPPVGRRRQLDGVGQRLDIWRRKNLSKIRFSASEPGQTAPVTNLGEVFGQIGPNPVGQSNSGAVGPGDAGAARPRWAQAAGVATRPRGVRLSMPSWSRKGS